MAVFSASVFNPSVFNTGGGGGSAPGPSSGWPYLANCVFTSIGGMTGGAGGGVGTTDVTILSGGCIATGGTGGGNSTGSGGALLASGIWGVLQLQQVAQQEPRATKQQETTFPCTTVARAAVAPRTEHLPEHLEQAAVAVAVMAAQAVQGAPV